MANITKITTHVEDAKKRLLEEYKGKVKIEGRLDAVVKQVQELEDIDFDMFTNRLDLNTIVGQQLDNFGTIVDQARQGFDDDRYRILLWVKIGINTSRGNPEKLISIIKLLTDATLAHYQNLNNAEVILAVDGTIDPTLIDFTYNNMQRVFSGGVRLNHIVCFDPVDPFRFAGSKPTSGFSSLAAPLVGGKFAFIHRRTLPQFKFAGDSSSGGFGTIQDPLVGGFFA